MKYLEPSSKQLPLPQMYACKIGGYPGHENLIAVVWVAVVVLLKDI
jgi:hypothetical protein